MKRFVIIAAVIVILGGMFFAGPIQALAETSLDDGLYSVEFTCEGGSGKGGVEAVEAEVEDGQITTLCVYMTSPYYDYCIYYGEQYKNATGEGNSSFDLPYVEESFLLTADTLAMSQPHEIDYTVTLDLDSMKPMEGGMGTFLPVIISGAVLLGIIILFIVLRSSGGRNER